MALLRDIVAFSNPRFGVDRTTGTIVELLRGFYDADGCLLILADSEPDRFVVRRAERTDPENALRAQSVNSKVAQNLISLPENYAAVFEKSDRPAFRGLRRFYVSEVPDKYNIKANREVFEGIAEKLDTRSFLTVPVFYRKRAVGRIFIFSKRFKVFDSTDIDFLLQAINQFMPIVENIRLVDDLASGAAEEERKKIARDIHDSVIQPYIGLRLGIESVINLLETGSANQTEAVQKAETIKTRINRLKDLTDRGIEDLRGYTSSLSERRGFETKLLPSIRSFAEKFGNATGISVEIKAADNIQINERLSAEVFQIVAEGLSNIRRHTDSPTARIDIAADKDKLVLAIENEFIDNGFINFTPKSISGRAGSLGGSIDVRQVDQKTVIRVEIPL